MSSSRPGRFYIREDRWVDSQTMNTGCSGFKRGSNIRTYVKKHTYYYYEFVLFSLALQPSAGYGLLWLCSSARAMASCGSAAQHGLWSPVALQPSAGYGLLWLCSPARAMASSFTKFLENTQRRATVGRTPLDE
jgi:hypothetical protein